MEIVIYFFYKCHKSFHHQRFFTDGKLAPAWGYQIDETASVVYGIYEHYQYNFLISVCNFSNSLSLFIIFSSFKRFILLYIK